MKTFFKIIFAFCVFALIAGFLSSITGCAKKKDTRPLTQLKLRVKVLCNGSSSYVYNEPQLRPLDTIWLNLTTHRQDDTDRNAMLVVIEGKQPDYQIEVKNSTVILLDGARIVSQYSIKDTSNKIVSDIINDNL